MVTAASDTAVVAELVVRLAARRGLQQLDVALVLLLRAVRQTRLLVFVGDRRIGRAGDRDIRAKIGLAR